jgi:hypothetical protein
MSAGENWFASSCKDLAMADRQLLAKLGVVVLLGLNVGAYCLLWPKNCERLIERAEMPPPSVPIPAPPKDFPVASVKNAEPISVPGEAAKNEKAAEAADAVSRLLDRIQKDNAQPIPVVGDGFAPPPPIPAPTKPSDAPPVVPTLNPRPLPPLKAESINDAATDPNVAIAPALTQRSQQSPWLVDVKKAGAQTLVIARLRLSSVVKLPAEFEIRCDRVDFKGADGLQAFGNITFIGAGIKGACQRLTVPWNAPTLIFVEQVRITPENQRGWSLPTTQLRGDRFVWEQPSNDVDINAAEFRPAGLLLPSVPTPGALGAPK